MAGKLRRAALIGSGMLAIGVGLWIAHQFTPERRAERVFSRLQRTHARWERTKAALREIESAQERRELGRLEDELEAQAVELAMFLKALRCRCGTPVVEYDGHRSDCRWVSELRGAGIR